MEDHLKKKDRLEKEWEALCAYEADPCSVNAASEKQNAGKNRYPDILPYDHSRVILNDLANGNNSDYINANTIVCCHKSSNYSFNLLFYFIYEFFFVRPITIHVIRLILSPRVHCRTRKQIFGK